MPKRRLPDNDGDEVEIVSSSFDIPGVGLGSSSNPHVLGSNSPSKPQAKPTNPRGQKRTPFARPSIVAADSHPFSYPTLAPQNPATSRVTQPPRAQQTAPHPVPYIASPDLHPYSYPAKPGPSMPQNQATSSAAPPPAKKQRKKKADPNAPVPEKRGAIFKKECPKNILERVDRVMAQRYA